MDVEKLLLRLCLFVIARSVSDVAISMEADVGAVRRLPRLRLAITGLLGLR
jgi:hypothetical protein